jgi:hypothetical protein
LTPHARVGPAALALCLAACGHVDTHEVLLRAPTAPSAEPVQVYFLGRLPERAYYEVALLQSVGYGDDESLEAVVHSLTERAAQIGCDALVRVHVDQGWSRTHAFGVCVRWSPVAPAGAAPANPSETTR